MEGQASDGASPYHWLLPHLCEKNLHHSGAARCLTQSRCPRLSLVLVPLPTLLDFSLPCLVRALKKKVCVDAQCGHTPFWSMAYHPAEEPRFYLLAPIVAGPPGLGCIEMYGQVG